MVATGVCHRQRRYTGPNPPFLQVQVVNVRTTCGFMRVQSNVKVPTCMSNSATKVKKTNMSFYLKSGIFPILFVYSTGTVHRLKGNGDRNLKICHNNGN